MDLYIDHISILDFESVDSIDLENQLIGLYKELGTQYPKFYKMNQLCKIAWLAGRKSWADYIEKEDLKLNDDAEKGIILYNYSSSLTSDWPHSQMLNADQMLAVSPSIFVYTLPNIANGELAIDLGWDGYTAFLVGNSKTDIRLIYENIAMSFAQFKLDLGLIGFIEVSIGIGKSFAKMAIISPTLKSGRRFNLETANSLFLP